MIPEPQAQTFLQDLSTMKGFPKSDSEGDKKLSLLVEHWAKICQSQEHGERMVDWILINHKFAPEVKDIYDAARATSGAVVLKGERPKYRECKDCTEGWVSHLFHVHKGSGREWAGEKICDALRPGVSVAAVVQEPERFLTSQQAARVRQILKQWPLSEFAYFTLGSDRCPNCWGKAA